jgi:hypothetical protein
MADQIDRLIGTLNISKVQTTNNALWQTIYGIITTVKQFNNTILALTANDQSLNGLNRIITYGTSSERLAFVPVQPPGVLVLFYETDTGLLYTFSSTGWNYSVGGITQLTGDVLAGPGTGSVVSTISNQAVTYAKIQNISAASRILGRGSSGSGSVEELVTNTGIYITGTTVYANGQPTITFIVGDGSGVISPGFKGWQQLNVAGTIVGATVLSVDSGSLVGNLTTSIYKSTFANFTTGSILVSGTSGPFLTATNKYSDSTLSSWTTNFSSGDIFGLNVSTATTVTKVIIQLFTK